MVFVVNGLEHALQLPRGTAVDDQDEGDSHWVGQHVLHRILVPLNVLVGFAWGQPEKPQRRGEAQRGFAEEQGVSLMLQLGGDCLKVMVVTSGPET